MIPVFTSMGFARFVTAKQSPAEIAGKVLPAATGLYRTAERREHPVIGTYWLAYYFVPKVEMVEEWAQRLKLDGLEPRQARALQRNIAH